jgi:hypothetical protein
MPNSFLARNECCSQTTIGERDKRTWMAWKDGRMPGTSLSNSQGFLFVVWVWIDTIDWMDVLILKITKFEGELVPLEERWPSRLWHHSWASVLDVPEEPHRIYGNLSKLSPKDGRLGSESLERWVQVGSPVIRRERRKGRVPSARNAVAPDGHVLKMGH